MKTAKVSFLWRKDGPNQASPMKVTSFGFLTHQRSVFVYGCDTSRRPKHDNDDEQPQHQATLLRFCDISNGAVLLNVPALPGMDPCLTNLKVDTMRDDDDVLFVSGDCSLWRVAAPNCQHCDSPQELPSHDAEAESTQPTLPELVCRPDAAPLHQQKIKQHPDEDPKKASFGFKGTEPSSADSDRDIGCHLPSNEHRSSAVTPTLDNTNVPDESDVSLCSSGVIHDLKSGQDTATGPQGPRHNSNSHQAAACCPIEAGKFIKSEGYRGARDGFQFRNGPWGRGYYSTKALLEGIIETVAAHEEIPAPPKLVGGASQGETGGATETTPQEMVCKNNNQLLIHSLLSAAPTLRCSVLSADGKTLYTGSWGKKDTAARAWDVKDAGKLVHCFEGHSGNVLSLVLSPDQGNLYSGSYDYTIREWDTFTGECIRELRSHRAGIHGLACSPDGSRMYSCAGDNTTRVWDLETGCCLRSLYGRHEDTTWPISMCISADGTLIATGSNGNMAPSTIKIFRVRGGCSHRDDVGSCLATLAHFKPDAKGSRSITALAFSSCGSVLLSGGSDGSIVAWKIETNVEDIEKNTGIKKGFL